MDVPEYFMGGYYSGGATGFMAEKRLSGHQNTSGDHQHFKVDDLLDFPNDEDIMSDGFLDNISNMMTESCTTNDHSSSATFTTTDSCNSTSASSANVAIGLHSFTDSHFSSELCVPYDDLAELEWLSNFVEDSFSTPTQQNLQTDLNILSGSKPHTPESSSSETNTEPLIHNPNNPTFQPETPLPGKARSKRSRAPPGDWSTRLLHLTPTNKTQSKKQEKSNPNPGGSDTMVRKCLHCGSEKTPQWRTGPLGPKTLCNACGVRYKSGRLVPEYRPAASPSFVSTKHSNSHRKVLELRRQKELERAQPQHEQFLSQTSIFGVSNGGNDFLIHHHHTHSGTSFAHLI